MVSTANEFIALPEVNDDLSLDSFNVLSMSQRGIIEFRGKPLLSASLCIDGRTPSFSKPSMERYWVPSMEGESGSCHVCQRLLAPFGIKGFVQMFTIQNDGDSASSFQASVSLRLDQVLHTVNESKAFEGSVNIYDSSWSGKPCLDIRSGFPIMAFACLDDGDWTWSHDASSMNGRCEGSLEAGQSLTLGVCWGFGFEEVAAVTAAKEILRLGIKRVLSDAYERLDSLIIRKPDPRLERLLNSNLLYCMHFAVGRTLDTEALICVTSRSPRYYVSAAYWDRDSLLWAFPAILKADSSLALEMLEYSFKTQGRNVGIHSRYIDGTVLEHGFELDELMAPIIALDQYISATEEEALLKQDWVTSQLKRIIQILARKHDCSCGLYETFLQPSDDMHTYVYLTYDNALVYKALCILGKWDFDGKGELWLKRAGELMTSIERHCIKDSMYVWSVDGKGNYDIYDEPPGSLLLLPLLGITSIDDPVYRKTAARILDPSYEFSFASYPFGAIGCKHAPHPWVLSLANQVKVLGDRYALEKLLKAPMDDYIACESIDENTGTCATGSAFATCAGFLASALMERC